MDSACEDSDAPLYDWNSDDEPPADRLFAVVVVSHDGEVTKRILKIGKGWDKPGIGDIVTVHFISITNPDDLSTIINVYSNPIIDSPSISVPIGFNSSLPCGVEQALRTMKRGEIALVSFPSNSFYSSVISNSHAQEDKRQRYEYVHTRQMKKKRAAIRRAEAKVKQSTYSKIPSLLINSVPVEQRLIQQRTIELPRTPRPSDGYPFSPVESNDEKSIPTRINIFRNEKETEVAVKEARNETAFTLDPPSHCFGTMDQKCDFELARHVHSLLAEGSKLYLVKLEDFKQIIGLTDDRGVLKETLKKSPPYKQSPQEGDFVSFSWTTLNGEKKVHLFRGSLKMELCPIMGLFSVIRSMREGERCICTLKGKYSLPVISEIADTSEIQLDVSLNTIHKVNTIKITDPCLLRTPLFHLESHEVISKQSGVKQQILIEVGCRVLVFVSVGTYEPIGIRGKTYFPFPMDDNQTLEAGLASWTVGCCVVPLWLDSIVMSMRPGQRIQIEIPRILFKDGSLGIALWPLFTSKQQKTAEVISNESHRKISSIVNSELSESSDVFPETVLVGKTSLLDPYVNSWSRDSIYLSDNSYLTEAEPTDIQPVLEALTDGEWNCSTGDVSQLAQLRKWFTANSVESQWSEKILEFLQENCTPSTISEGSKSSQFLVDIQLIDVLGRNSTPWIISEQERVARALKMRDFANFLFKEGFLNQATILYNQALDVLRFCDSQDKSYLAIAAGPVESLAPSDRSREDQVQAKIVNELICAIHLNVAFVQLKLRGWRECIESCDMAIKHGGASDPKSYFRMATAQLELSQLNEANSSIQKALQIDPLSSSIMV